MSHPINHIGSGTAVPWVNNQRSSQVQCHPINHMGSGAVDPWVCHMERLEFSVSPPYPQGLWCPAQLTTLALGPQILGPATLRTAANRRHLGPWRSTCLQFEFYSGLVQWVQYPLPTVRRNHSPPETSLLWVHSYGEFTRTEFNPKIPHPKDVHGLAREPRG